MALIEEDGGQRIDNLYPGNNITYQGLCESIDKDEFCSFRLGDIRVKNIPGNWVMELDYIDSTSETRFYIEHEYGFMTLRCPFNPQSQECVENGKEIIEKINMLLGFKPCCRFETSSGIPEELSQVYVYSDGLSADECFNKFEDQFEKDSRGVLNLEKLI